MSKKSRTEVPWRSRLTIGGLWRERMQASARYRDGRFHDPAPVGAGLKGNPLPVLGEFFFSKGQRVPPFALQLTDPSPASGNATEAGSASGCPGGHPGAWRRDGAATRGVAAVSE